MVKPTINTTKGVAYYTHTEVEDEHGNWNDRWASIQGEFVIHKGRKHHVYDVNGVHIIKDEGKDKLIIAAKNSEVAKAWAGNNGYEYIKTTVNATPDMKGGYLVRKKFRR